MGEYTSRLNSILIVTANGKVINGDVIKDLKYISSEYIEVRSLGISEVEDEKFIVSGYAVKDRDSGKKDGFLMQFDKNGNKDSEMKIIPSYYSQSNNASINMVIKSYGGNIMISGTELLRTYINHLDYVDNRQVKESLTLLNGKSYKVVKETNKLSITTTNKCETIYVGIDKVEAGTPIEVVKPQPPVEEEKTEVKPEQKQSAGSNQIVNADNGEKIVFDINKPMNIEIVSSKLKNKDFKYILVNGIKVTKTIIEGKLTRDISSIYSTKEYFTVNDVDKYNKLPNTGFPINTDTVSIFAMLSAFIGSVILKKKRWLST